MGTQLPSPKGGGRSPQFSAHVYCCQTAGWTKMPLSTEVDLSPSHTVLDGDPAPPAKGAQQLPLFSAHVYCGHGRPSQLLLSSCRVILVRFRMVCLVQWQSRDFQPLFDSMDLAKFCNQSMNFNAFVSSCIFYCECRHS